MMHVERSFGNLTFSVEGQQVTLFHDDCPVMSLDTPSARQLGVMMGKEATAWVGSVCCVSPLNTWFIPSGGDRFCSVLLSTAVWYPVADFLTSLDAPISFKIGDRVMAAITDFFIPEGVVMESCAESVSVQFFTAFPSGSATFVLQPNGLYESNGVALQPISSPRGPVTRR